MVLIARICLAVTLVFSGFQLFGQARKTAQSPPGGHASQMGAESAGMLRGLDTDHDGFVSREEWDHLFAGLDQNHDNRLSSEELTPEKPVGKEESDPDIGRRTAFDRLDTDGNNAVQRSEWPGKPGDFEFLDADDNGSLSHEEFLARNGRWWNLPFESLDFNGDGIIARFEWLDSNAVFDRLDRNHNGTIERNEFYRPR